MQITNDGVYRYAKIRITGSHYCDSCNRNFEEMELVFYAPLDNTIICKECAKVHSELKPRLYVKGE